MTMGVDRIGSVAEDVEPVGDELGLMRITVGGKLELEQGLRA